MLNDYMFSGRKHYTIFIFVLLLSFNSLGQIFYNDLESNSVSDNWIGLQSIDSGFAHSGNYYSHTDSVNVYGLGFEDQLPEGLIRKNTVVLISGFIQNSSINTNPLFVITIIDSNNETLLWKGISLKNGVQDINTWVYFSDSVLIPASLTDGSKIKAYLWNQEKSSSVNLDDLRIEFKEFLNPTYLPDFNIPSIDDTILDKKLYNNNYYSISLSLSNSILLKSNNGDYILNNISYLSDKNINDKNYKTQSNWKYLGQKKSTSGTVLKFSTKTKGGKTKLDIFCDNYNGVIKLNIEEKYQRKQEVSRNSIVFEYAQSLSEVYRKNRKTDNEFFQDEYWLDKQGVKIGSGQSSFYIYHTPEISSMQLDSKNQLLFANLDYRKDHPFFRFPLNPDSSNWKLEESFSYFKRGDKQTYSFSMNIGNHVHTIPRFMKNPLGFEATYIWTEHADYSDIRTNRATYFGSENISNADSATGGFVYYNIPVTKSVFYDNPDSISNLKASNGLFSSLESTILTDDEFSDFLFQISKKGSDVCLHTPEQYTTTPERFEEALLYMQMNFGSPSWIDHGNNNGPQNNREDLICDATLKKSPFYAIDLWEKYGVKYLHNAYYEELNTFKNWKFEGSLEKPYSGYGDFIPTPDYFQHPTKTDNLYHWTTTSALFISEPYLWNYLFNEKKLNNMVNNWYVEINHVYPAWVDPKKGMWTWGSDSTIIAQLGFNQSLSNLAYYRYSGRLNITTIAEFLDYRTAIDNIEYQLLPDGRVKLVNNNDFDIVGLSMAGNAKLVTVDGSTPQYKIAEDNIIFWFNIKANSSKIIRLIK